jgi:hypothetical protein
LGSANLTRNALGPNQEIVASIESEDPRFNELTSLFSDYWNGDDSQVLTDESLNAYEAVYKKYSKAIDDIARIDEETQAKLGTTVFSNIIGLTQKFEAPAESRRFMIDNQTNANGIDGVLNSAFIYSERRPFFRA